MNIRHKSSTPLTATVAGMLAKVSTATIASQLQMRGYQNCFLNGLKPLDPAKRLLGIARTLRYLPMRPDLHDLAGDVQRDTVERIQPGEVLVIDARGEPDAGTIGDIYALRVKMRGGQGVITDGALRDTPAIRRIGLPVYHQTSNAATLSRRHVSVDCQVPVACGGATVLPGDVLVGDGEGVVVIPAHIMEEIAEASLAMEIEEEFVLERIAEGASTLDYFPLQDEAKQEYAVWRAARED
ncbi:ribonuclease activity regulator RraA [Tabrizicola sp.]|uniref:RraA family protein n=1 Tax=Tabrizicola sp. TaxID=2005166 RepID=UPI0035AF8544